MLSVYDYNSTFLITKMSQVSAMRQTSALVIGYETVSTKYGVRTKSLMCQYHGKMFKVSCDSENMQRSPPNIGKPISIQFMDLSSEGVPLNARIKYE